LRHDPTRAVAQYCMTVELSNRSSQNCRKFFGTGRALTLSQSAAARLVGFRSISFVLELRK
jgi:hypothetical protein